MTTEFSGWIGRKQWAVDIIDLARTNALAAALGEDSQVQNGDHLPPLHHWLYFWDVRPPDGLGGDGHPARGGLLPPIRLPNRMWAGSRVEFLAPLLVGGPARRVSTILDVKAKTGRSGDLAFVTVEHELFGADGLAVREQQDIVYRGRDRLAEIRSQSPPAEVRMPDWTWDVKADPVLLFRYSGLTMNGHRIHYDHPYATGVEKYPGLVVHGPLQATLMVGLARRHLARPVRQFHFRGLSPAFDLAPLKVAGAASGDGANLWVEQDGRLCMSGGVAC